MVSIVVITYNSSKTVLETLDSIANQTFKDIEIIVSDDASKDNTIEIVEGWFDSHEIKHKVVSVETNTGVPANCNRGVQAATYDLVKIIAGDDVLMNNAIEVYYEAYLQDKKSIFQSQVELFGDVQEPHRQYCANNCKKLKQDDNKKYCDLLKHNYMLAPAVGLYQKNVINAVGGFDERYKLFEDYPMYLKLIRKGYNFKLIEQPLVKYRVSAGSVSNLVSEKYMESYTMFFKKEKIYYLIERHMYISVLKEMTFIGMYWVKQKILSKKR